MREIYKYDPVSEKVYLAYRIEGGGATPDVYFDKPGTHHGIYHPETGEAIFITSKSHKAHEMKKWGLSEAGDPVGGKRNFDPISYRHAMKSLEK